MGRHPPPDAGVATVFAMNTLLATIPSHGRTSVPPPGWDASRPLLPSDASLREIVEMIFRQGAVLSCAHCPPILLGDFHWEEPSRIRWFPAFGDRESDAGVFSFHYAHADASRAEFRHAGGSRIEITTIDEAEVDDRDDYRVAWQIWQHVVPLQAKLIQAAYARLGRP